jgi:hypothetical protein
MVSKQTKCLDEYATVQEYADEVLGDYQNWYVGYGEAKETNVRQWYESIMIDPKCQCNKCGVK